jgi:hypothetical protein
VNAQNAAEETLLKPSTLTEQKTNSGSFTAANAADTDSTRGNAHGENKKVFRQTQQTHHHLQ